MQHAKNVLVVTACLAVIYGIYHTSGAKELTEKLLLERELESFITPVVTHSEELPALPYLRAQKYLIETRIDPSFAIEGVDLYNLTQGVQDLQSSVDLLTPFYPIDQQETFAALYPINFFSRLIQLEQKRRELLIEPSIAAIDTYHQLVNKTIDAYTSDAQAYINALLSEESYLNKPLRFKGGVTDIDTIVDGLYGLLIDARALQEKEMHRYSCLKRGVHCTSLSKTLSTRTVETNATAEEGNSIPHEKIKENTLFIDAIYRALTGKEPQKKPQYQISLNTPSCFTEENITFQPRWPTSGETNRVHIEMLDDIYFNTTEQSTKGHLFSLKERGIVLEFQPATNPYLCIDSGIDNSRVLRAYAIYEQLTTNSDMSSKLPGITSLHENVVDDIVQEKHIRDFLSTLSKEIQKEGETAFSKKYGIDSLIFSETLLLAWQTGTPRFDESIAQLAKLNTYIVNFIQDGQPPIPLLFVERGYPSILFLPFNKTIALSGTTFFRSKENALLPETSPLRSYIYDLKDTFSKEDILEEVRKN